MARDRTTGRPMVVADSSSRYQRADESEKDEVGAEHVALAFVTGNTGKERHLDDYEVTLHVQQE
ncbi:MAG: hypothetical protein PVI30_23400 [Myxococcales bacterium]